MNGALWLGVFLVVYPALQLPVILYLSRYVELDAELPFPPTRRYWAESERDSPDYDPHSRVADEDAVACPRCGRSNANGFAYCRFCVYRLA